jgi:NAD-dependent dihydropyrimidine dehydrogenase PreA subunit
MRYLRDVVTLELDREKCSGCGTCAVVCPHRVFAMEEKRASLADRDACMECGACALNCPDEAIAVKSVVGCATGVINGLLRGTEPSCDCSDGSVCC